MGLLIKNLPQNIPGVQKTRTTLQTIELAMKAYHSSQGMYPFETYNGNINLSDSSDPNIIIEVNNLQKYESIPTDENGHPIDYWGNPIYLILSKNYSIDSISQQYKISSSNLYYNEQSMQLISGGPDGTKLSLGETTDNVYNFDRN